MVLIITTKPRLVQGGGGQAPCRFNTPGANGLANLTTTFKRIGASCISNNCVKYLPSDALTHYPH